jgi:mannose-6-phosphate isomerase-like protein (cupin superfamily)
MPSQVWSAMKKSRYIPGEVFHDGEHGVYEGQYGWAVNKQSKHMARVVYERVHENKDFKGVRRGEGLDYAKWVFSEEPGLAEDIFQSGFELMIDAEMEPNSAIGLHWHHRTEEIYYILGGSIRMTTVNADGDEHSETLKAGDAHAVLRGQGHYGRVGADGVRFMAVSFRRE